MLLDGDVVGVGGGSGEFETESTGFMNKTDTKAASRGKTNMLNESNTTANISFHPLGSYGLALNT